ncbi:MAG: hypothetical protein M4579_000036 [Chaenotheca gracillima]|nr:MAG: hypothetical protein M4579_000036 [Chaenotheca gracillima]
MSTIALASKAFLYGASTSEVHGLEEFLQILDERREVDQRDRGLITVSNHVSIVDDPLIWGALPLRYAFSPTNLRWSLGSYDIVFKNKPLTTFFTLGQVLPTHRRTFSPHGGLFQPTVTECIRLLSRPVQSRSQAEPPDVSHREISDPFAHPNTIPQNTYYTTTGTDSFLSPSLSHPHRNAHAWIHIFPEGRIHQHPTHALRYFKWGVARLILESDPLPRVVPMWIEGPEEIMHESRTFPRFLPRPGKHVKVVFGREVDTEGVFGGLRREWQELVARDRASGALDRIASGRDGQAEHTDPRTAHVGSELSPRLKYGDEAVRLRIEVTRRVRDEILKLRKGAGWPDEDPKAGFPETWRVEGPAKEGKMADGSWISKA